MTRAEFVLYNRVIIYQRNRSAPESKRTYWSRSARGTKTSRASKLPAFAFRNSSLLSLPIHVRLPTTRAAPVASEYSEHTSSISQILVREYDLRASDGKAYSRSEEAEATNLFDSSIIPNAKRDAKEHAAEGNKGAGSQE